MPRYSYNTNADNEITGVSYREDPIQASYDKYVQENPEPVHYESPAPAPAPTTAPAPTGSPTTGGTTGTTTTPDTTPSWIMDAHFSQQYFLDEAQKRKNPDYVSEIADVPDAAIENIALAIKGRQENHPDQWKYGDPGWNSEDPLWYEYIKPLEDAYQEQSRVQAIKAQQAQESIARDKLAGNARFSKAIVDTSDADISTLSNSGKVISYATPSYAGTDAKNQSGIAKYTQQLLGSWMSGGGTAKAASMAAGLMGFGNVQAVNLVVHGLTSGYQLARNTGHVKPIKSLDKIIEYSDIADEKMQNALGALAYAFEKTGGDDLYDPSQAIKSTKHLVENAGDIIHYAYGSGKASTEYPKEVVGAVTGMSANIAGLPLIGDEISRGLRNALSANFGDDEYITRYQTTRANSGLPGVYDLDKEMVGSNGIMFWLDLGKFLYDNGMTDENEIKNEIQFMISQYYGDRATFSEYLEHEMVDPGNTIENMDSRVIQGYASAMGKLQGIDPEHNNLLRAAQANTGTWLGDLTGGIPLLPDIAREIGRAKGNPNFMSTSGGMNEVFAQWHRENITNPAEDLTSLDRRFSGISEDNKISRVMPNPNTSKNILERVGNAVHNFFSETNESRAAFEGEAIFAYIDQGIEDAISARGSEDTQTTINRINQFVDELENPDKIDIENSPFAENYKSVLYNSIKDDLAEAVRAHRAEINEHINRYFAENLDTDRQTLYTLAKALNLTPQQLLDKYQNDKPRLTQMILNLADKNGGKIEGIDIDVESKEFGDAVMKRIAPFAGDEGEPWDLRMLGIQISTSIADGVTDTLINKFGIKPDKFIYRFGDTIKKMQNLLLLGLSPSYLANNLINNMVTRTSLGYGGYMSTKTIGNWMKRFGYSPDRFMDSISNEIGQESKIGDSKYGRLIDGIREKKRVKGVLDKIGNFSSKASSAVGVFGNLSNKVESSESQQIVAAAMMNYMARTWKKGVNFRRMPIELEQAIEEQMPGMTDTIYSAISSGINMEEIEKALFGTFIAPSVEGTLKTAAQRLGVDEELINEYFVKNGMLDQLQQSLHGKQGAEIDNVIADFAERLKSLLSIEFDEEIARRAETIGNQVTEEGFATAINCAYDSADEWNDIWTNSILVNRRIFQRRIEEGIPTKEFRAMYQEHQRNLTERWENVYKKAQQTFEGILRGIGIKDKNNQNYLKALNDKNSLWLNFYKKTQPELIQPYLNSLAWIEGDTKESWDSRVTKAWNDYQTAIESAVNDVYKAEADLQKDMDKAYLAGLKEAVGAERAGEIDSKFQPIFDKINAKRAEIIEQTKLVRKEANKTNELLKKNKAYLDAEQVRKDLIDQYTNFQHELYEAIDSYRSIITNKVSDTNTQANHSGKIALEIEQAKARRQQRKAEINSERATDAIAEGADAVKANAYAKHSEEFFKQLPVWAQNILNDPNDERTLIEKRNDVIEELKYDASNKLVDLLEQARANDGRELEYYEKAWVAFELAKTLDNLGDVAERFISDEMKISIDEALAYNGDQAIINSLYDNHIDIEQIWKEAREIDWEYESQIDNLELATDMRNSYFMNRKTLSSIALRAGATQEVADAFSRYVSLVADKWEKNHPGEDFFHDADGIAGLRIIFHENSDPNAAGNYVYRDRIINLFSGGQDIFTLLHELGHGFQWTLNEDQQRELAQYFGISYEDYVNIQDAYANERWEYMTDEQKAQYFDITETFARGFADYLATNTAPTKALTRIFREFKKFVEQIFGEVSEFIIRELDYDKDWYLNYIGVTPETIGIAGTGGIVRAGDVSNGITLQQIFDQFTSGKGKRKDYSDVDFASNDKEYHVPNTDTNLENEYEFIGDVSDSDINENVDEEEDPEASAMRFLYGQFAPVDETNFEVFETMDNLRPYGTYGDAVSTLAGDLYDRLKDLVYPKDETNPGNMFAPPTVEELMQYIMQDTDEDGATYISAERSKNIDFLVESVDDYGDLRDRINDLRTYRQTFATPPSEGTYVGRCYKFEYGEYNFENNNPIVGMVYHNGEVVAYVPLHMEQWEIPDSEDNTKTYKVLGVSPENPAQWVYKNGDEIITESLGEEPETNPHSGEMDKDTMPTHDPTGDAHNKLAYESILNLLQEFASLYKHDLTDNMSKYKFNDLSDDVKEFVRGYISRDVRQDLNNTKYKAGKFGEMMRDAALLNYNKRYGFDNFFTLLCPYQFWMSRSVINWLTRMNTKGGKMWRKYYKLKEIERRNKKEFMPSKITGKFGMYIPGLPDWMGDAIFMSTDQLFVVNQFVEPVLDRLKKKNSILAAAEKYLQEEFEEGNISYQQYLSATNEETKENDPNWQAALARAQLENDSNTGLGNLFQQYFGWNLPVSTMQALISGDQSGWNQWPITRTGTAFRAILDNTGLKDVGKGVQMVLSAPEKALRDAAVKTFGDSFAYNEFGAFGNYYITQQVFDMVVEGRIEASDAVQATIEKDGNPIWEEAADRQRQETLVKMQSGSVIDATKKLIKDWRAGDKAEDTIGDDIKYLFASIITAPMSKAVVHESERTWRQDKADLNKAYEAKANGDKDAVNRYYNEHEYATYNNLRYEDNTETMLRQFLYKSITDKYYDLDKAEQNQINMSFGPDFQKYVLDKETRAIDAMDINKLAAYAQALNDKIPYLATDKLNTMNVQPMPIMSVPQTTLDEYNEYLKLRDELYPGMSRANSIYYDLPAEDRAYLTKNNPQLVAYQNWDKQYKKDHENVKMYSSLVSANYDVREMEDFCSKLDPLTMRHLKTIAYSDKQPDKEYKMVIENLMKQMQITDKYDYFIKDLKKYILGE